MKISKLIKELEAIRTAKGDMEVGYRYLSDEMTRVEVVRLREEKDEFRDMPSPFVQLW